MDRGWGKTRALVIFTALLLGSVSFAQPFQALEDVVSRASSFSDFLSQPKLVQAYKAALQTYYGTQKFSCESYEDILARLTKLNAEVPGFGEEIWKKEEASSVVAFRAEANASTERFRWELAPVPRKLHAIWNDPSQRGCVSEDCGKAEITAPERWAVGLPGSRAYLLHRNGKFSGSGLVLFPVAKGKETFSLVTPTGTGPLEERAGYSASPSGRVSSYSFLDRFVDEWKGAPAVSVQYDKKDASVARVNRLRSGKGKAFAGFLDEFKPASPMATSVAKVIPRQCFAKKGSEINLFAGFNGAGPSQKPPTFNLAIRDLLAQVNNPNNLSAVVDVPSDQKEQTGKALAELMKKDKSAAMREKAALALRLLDKFGTEDGKAPPPVMRIPASQGEQAPSPPKSKRGAFNDDFREGLKDSNPGVRGASASALASQGDRSPEVQRELDSALQADSPTPAGMSPGDLAALAASGMNQGGQQLSQDNLASLLNQLSGADEAARRRLLAQFADSFKNSKNPPDAIEALEDLARRDPQAAEDAQNEVNKTDCPEVEAREKAQELQEQALKRNQPQESHQSRQSPVQQRAFKKGGSK